MLKIMPSAWTQPLGVAVIVYIKHQKNRSSAIETTTIYSFLTLETCFYQVECKLWQWHRLVTSSMLFLLIEWLIFSNQCIIIHKNIINQLCIIGAKKILIINNLLYLVTVMYYFCLYCTPSFVIIIFRNLYFNFIEIEIIVVFVSSDWNIFTGLNL